MENLFNFLFLYGLEVTALVILFASGVFARWLAVVVLGGILAAGLMIAQVVLWVFLAGIGSATSGSQHGYSIALGFAVGSSVALAVYFRLAVSRYKHLRRRHADGR